MIEFHQLFIELCKFLILESLALLLSLWCSRFVVGPQSLTLVTKTSSLLFLIVSSALVALSAIVGLLGYLFILWFAIIWLNSASVRKYLLVRVSPPAIALRTTIPSIISATGTFTPAATRSMVRPAFV